MVIKQCFSVLLGLILGGFLWFLGGNGFRWCREYLLPVFLAGIKFYLTQNYWSFLYAVAAIALIKSFNYGITSRLHKFWVSIFHKGEDGNYQPVEIVTRGTCGFFWSLSGITFIFLGGNWLHQLYYTIFLTLANIIFGAVVKEVRISEPAIGASFACSLLI